MTISYSGYTKTGRAIKKQVLIDVLYKATLSRVAKKGQVRDP